MPATPLETVLRGTGSEVVIGHGRRFCLIGERINPTGRRIFQEQLRAGDLSAIERDVKAQVEGGADVLDVNMGVPLTDEAELLAKAITLVQSLTDKPICIDSSVVEALEAGLSTYQGRALVNSITAEDERMEQILPLVKKYDAAVIALPNDSDEIPMEAEKRLVLTRKIFEVATKEYGIAAADIVIDPLAMPIGADQQVTNTFFEVVRAIRDEFGANMTCGASNTSFGMPGRHQIGAAFLPMAMGAGLTSAIMDTRTPHIVEAVKAADLLLGHDESGRRVDRGAPSAAGRRSRGDVTDGPTTDDLTSDGPAFTLDDVRREGLMAAPGTEPATHDGTGRVDLRFTVHSDAKAPPAERSVPRAAGGHRLRLGVVERHRDRLHLWRPRHLPQVPGPRGRCRPGHPARHPHLHP